jgi:hypothetical protein
MSLAGVTLPLIPPTETLLLNKIASDRIAAREIGRIQQERKREQLAIVLTRQLEGTQIALIASSFFLPRVVISPIRIGISMLLRK